MAYHYNDGLSADDRFVTEASREYYRTLLKGGSSTKRRYLWQAWLCALQKRWPELDTAGLCRQCLPSETSCSGVREERWRMIAEAAYFRARRRRFRDGNPEQDWLEAEREIDHLYFGTANSLQKLCCPSRVQAAKVA